MLPITSPVDRSQKTEARPLSYSACGTERACLERNLEIRRLEVHGTPVVCGFRAAQNGLTEMTAQFHQPEISPPQYWACVESFQQTTPLRDAERRPDVE